MNWINRIAGTSYVAGVLLIYALPTKADEFTNLF